MRKTSLLSGYLFQWYMKKGGWYIYALAMGIGILSAVARAFGGLSGGNNVYLAKGFLPYEVIIDQSWIPFTFHIGLILLVIYLLWQMRKYRTGGKAIYTFYTLPMEGKEVAASFLLTTAAILFLYYALWLILILILYFPLMHAMVSLAARQEFLMADGSIVTGIDAARNNGLFLAFVRSNFLNMAYSLNWRMLFRVMSLLLLCGTAVSMLGLTYNGASVAILIYFIFDLFVNGYKSLFQIDLTSDGTTHLVLGIIFLLLSVGNMVYLCRRMEKPRAK